MKNFIMQISVALIIIALSLLLSKIIFEKVYYSDMPIWLKYFLLKG